MTHQALYNAGGIGDLHQKVHVAEHDMGPGHEKEPALVVHMEPNLRPAQEHRPDKSRLPVETKQNALKIGLMDFLTNNLDRHGGNLMVGTGVHENPDGAKHEASNRLLAIDHSRSFQYANNRSNMKELRLRNVPGFHQKNYRLVEDNFKNYVSPDTGRLSDYVGLPNRATARSHDQWYEDRLNHMQDVTMPVFEWWAQNSPKIRETFEKKLEQIKSPALRDHLRRNFKARADALDERAGHGHRELRR